MSEFELFSEDEIKEEIIRISKTLYDRSLITALGGNISARIPGAGRVLDYPEPGLQGCSQA
ncbi:MAG: hypothetical protein L2C94_004690 [Aigarchaeota archaeon]|nr:hypothetical protein [Candidatus Wolframiiraptor gerlachensis]